MYCPIVTIETKNGPVDINESDFDSKKHKLYVEKSPKPKAKKKAK